MKKRQSPQQQATLALFLVSLVLAILGVYFNKFHGIPFARYGIYTSTALSILVLIKFRTEIAQLIGAVMIANLAGLTLGSGLAMTGIWFVIPNPERALVGPKWLLIGTAFLVAYAVSFKTLRFEPEKPELTEDELGQMSRLERLKHIESSFMDEETFAPIKKGPMDALGMSFIAVGLVAAIGLIVSTKSSSDRWIMIGILAVIVPAGAWFVVYMRRKTFGKFNKIMTDIDVHRQELLVNVRAEIAEIEGGGQLPPP